MNIILLSGGSGKRLWPLSNDVRSKQFIKIFENDETGILESMVQRVYRQIKRVIPSANIVIATSKAQVSEIKNQLEDNVSICVEPKRRDTFPAIALAVEYLKDELKVSENESVIVCPVDPYVNLDYFEHLNELADLTDKGTHNLNLIGVEPTYPSEKYGYIIPVNSQRVSEVKSFKEKPTSKVANEYIKDGALWNCGVFGFKISYLDKIAHEMVNFRDYRDLYNMYSTLTKISFDYAVVEHEKSIQSLRFNGMWKDLGTWNTFTEEMKNSIVGNGVLNETCKNSCIINEMSIPVLGMGLKNIIVAVGNDGILVTEKEQSSYIKSYVENFNQQVMFAEKSWGSFTILNVEEKSLTIKITLTAGHAIHYHKHENRDEVWTVISGKGKILLDDIEKNVSVGDVIILPRESKHKLSAITNMTVIEIQTGDVNVHDKYKFD